jgi:hypothetical protein
MKIKRSKFYQVEYYDTSPLEHSRLQWCFLRFVRDREDPLLSIKALVSCHTLTDNCPLDLRNGVAYQY